MPNVDPEPEYVRERIEDVSNLGRKFLASLALCTALIATIEGGVRIPDLLANASTLQHKAPDQVSLEAMVVETCRTGNHLKRT